MNDTQMQAMSLARHQRILARVQQQEQAAAASARPAESFAAVLNGGPEIAPVPTPEAPVGEPAQRVLATTAPAVPTAAPAAAPAMPQLSADQAALLAASLGATLPEDPAPAAAVPPVTPTPTAAAQAAPDLSEDQMSALMSAFGQPEAAPQAAAAAVAATVIPQQDDNLRYFPINRTADNNASNAAAQMTASDTYLRAMQQMERNLGAYGGLTRNGR